MTRDKADASDGNLSSASSLAGIAAEQLIASAHNHTDRSVIFALDYKHCLAIKCCRLAALSSRPCIITSCCR